MTKVLDLLKFMHTDSNGTHSSAQLRQRSLRRVFSLAMWKHRVHGKFLILTVFVAD